MSFALDVEWTQIHLRPCGTHICLGKDTGKSIWPYLLYFLQEPDQNKYGALLPYMDKIYPSSPTSLERDQKQLLSTYIFSLDVSSAPG